MTKMADQCIKALEGGGALGKRLFGRPRRRTDGKRDRLRRFEVDDTTQDRVVLNLRVLFPDRLQFCNSVSFKLQMHLHVRECRDVKTDRTGSSAAEIMWMASKQQKLAPVPPGPST